MSKKTNKTSSQSAKVTPVKATPAKNDQATGKSNYGLLISLVVVLVAALIVIGVMFSQNSSKNDQLVAANDALTDVTNKYEETKNERDELKKQLSDAEEALDEANLSLEEANAMVARLTDEVNSLTAQNTANTETIAATQAELDHALNVQAHTLSTVNEIKLAISTLEGNLAAMGIEMPETEPAAEEPVVTEEPATATDVIVPVEDEAAESTEEAVEAEPIEDEAAVSTEEAVEAEPIEDEAAPVESTEEAAEVETTEPAEEVAEAAEEAVEPEATPAVEYPVVNVSDEGTVIETEAAVVTLTVDENNAIATLTATVNGEAVTEDVTALFIGKALPLNTEEFTLDEAGVMQAIIDALNVLAEPALVNG